MSKYLGSGRPHADRGDQRWATFVRNRAKAIVACDFFVSVSATFRVFYVFVAMEIGSRRILHINVTDHPTVEWTIQQFREFLAYDHPFRFVIHDRDSIFSRAVDQALKDCGVRALKTPVRTPTANAFCERVIGTIRRECLAFIFSTVFTIIAWRGRQLSDDSYFLRSTGPSACADSSVANKQLRI